MSYKKKKLYKKVITSIILAVLIITGVLSVVFTDSVYADNTVDIDTLINNADKSNRYDSIVGDSAGNGGLGMQNYSVDMYIDGGNGTIKFKNGIDTGFLVQEGKTLVIENLTIDGAGITSHVFDVRKGGTLILRNVHITGTEIKDNFTCGAGRHGIILSAGERNSKTKLYAKDTTISNCGMSGISAWDNTEFYLEGCTISNNGLNFNGLDGGTSGSGGFPGISTVGKNITGTINGGSISNNHGHGISNGDNMNGKITSGNGFVTCNNVTIESNAFSGSMTWFTARTILNGCTIQNNRNHGVEAICDNDSETEANLINVKINGGTISGNKVGVYIKQGKGLTKADIKQTIITSNGEEGVFVSKGATVTMKFGTVSYNGHSGVKVVDSSTATLTGGTIRKNTEQGVETGGNAKVYINGGTILENNNGIKTLGNSQLYINTDENSINSTYYGETKIYSNGLTGNNGHGIWAAENSQVNIYNCELGTRSAEYNRLSGICADDNSKVSVVNSRLSYCKERGLAVYKYATVKVSGGTIAGNGGDAIYIERDGGGQEISGVTIASNVTVSGTVYLAAGSEGTDDKGVKGDREYITVTGGSKALTIKADNAVEGRKVVQYAKAADCNSSVLSSADSSNYIIYKDYKDGNAGRLCVGHTVSAESSGGTLPLSIKKGSSTVSNSGYVSMSKVFVNETVTFTADDAGDVKFVKWREGDTLKAYGKSVDFKLDGHGDRKYTADAKTYSSYVLTFDANWGSFEGQVAGYRKDASGNLRETDVKYGEEWYSKEQTGAHKDNQEFLGWTLTRDGNDYVFDSNGTYVGKSVNPNSPWSDAGLWEKDGGVTVFARYGNKKSAVIKFNADGGSPAQGDVNVTAGSGDGYDVATPIKLDSNDVKLRFCGWARTDSSWNFIKPGGDYDYVYESGAGTGSHGKMGTYWNAGGEWCFTGDDAVIYVKAVYGDWSTGKVTVSFNGNGRYVTGSIAPVKGSHGQTIEISPNNGRFVRPGYKFVHWSDIAQDAGEIKGNQYSIGGVTDTPTAIAGIAQDATLDGNPMNGIYCISGQNATGYWSNAGTDLGNGKYGMSLNTDYNRSSKNNQFALIYNASKDAYKLVSVATGLAVDYWPENLGGRLYQYTLNDRDTQYWKITRQKTDNSEYRDVFMSAGVDNKAVTINPPSLIGADFNGINDRNRFTLYWQGSVITSMTLYAHWQPYTYSIKYNPNGGSGSEWSTGSITFDDTTEYMIASDAFTRASYRQDGWSRTPGGEKEYGLGERISPSREDAGGFYKYLRKMDGSIVPSGDNDSITLYAHWVITDAAYKVEHYQQNVGNDSYTLADTDTGLTGTIGQTASYTAKTYTGFHYAKADVPVIAADGSTVVKVYYDRNTHNVSTVAGTGISSTSGGGSGVRYGAGVTIDAQVKSGYTWSKWTGYTETTTKSYTFTMPDSDVSFTANAVANTYYIHFDANGGKIDGSASEADRTIAYNTACSTIADRMFMGNERTALRGYTLTGWNTKADGSGETVFDAVAQAVKSSVWSDNGADALWLGTGNITVYAQWRDVEGPRISVTPDRTYNPDAKNDAVKNIDVTITVVENGSGLDPAGRYEYGLSTSKSEPPESWGIYKTGSPSTDFAATVNIGEGMNGTYYLWVRQVSDCAGNKSTSPDMMQVASGGYSYHVCGTYTFDNEGPVGKVRYVENNITLGLYDDEITDAPYASMMVNGADDGISGIRDIKLVIYDAADEGNIAQFYFEPDKNGYLCRFNLYDCLENPENVERVRMKVVAADRVGNISTLQVNSFDFGSMQTGQLIQAEDIGYEEIITEADTPYGKTVYEYERDAFRVEAYIENISYKRTGTQFMGGHKGRLRIYTFGQVKGVSADFGSVKKYINTNYDENPDLNYTALGKACVSYLYPHEFFIPLYCRNSTYTDTVAYGFKGKIGQHRNVVYEVTDSITSHIRTILKYQ